MRAIGEATVLIQTMRGPVWAAAGPRQSRHEDVRREHNEQQQGVT